MTGMTPERLNEVARYHRESPRHYVNATAADELLAEVERLHSIEAGIEAALRTSREMQAEQRSSVTLAFLQGALDDLLNPTEGETDA